MDFYVLKRWIYLAIAVSVSVASCWGSVRVIQAKDAHGHDREPRSVKSTDDLGPDDPKRPRSSILTRRQFASGRDIAHETRGVRVFDGSAVARLNDPEARREMARLKEKHELFFRPTPDGGEFSHTRHGRCLIHLANDREDLAMLLVSLRDKGVEPAA
jgi:hypothetical protein